MKCNKKKGPLCVCVVLVYVHMIGPNMKTKREKGFSQENKTNLVFLDL